jgi:hypothetical protein
MAPATGAGYRRIGGYFLRTNHKTIGGVGKANFPAAEKMRKPSAC